MKPLNILVVDDSPQFQLIASYLIKSLPCVVRTAGSVADAVELALDDIPDLIFSDIVMPEQNGFDLAKSVRTHPELKDVILVAVSNSDEDRVREEALKSGFDEFLPKPLSADALKWILRHE